MSEKTDNPVAEGIRSRMRLLVTVGIAIIVLAGAGVGLRFWYLNSSFISTDNARIDAALIQVGPLNAGRIVALEADIGNFVTAGDRVAVIELPSVLNISGQAGFGGFPTRMGNITAPVSGYVAAVWAQPGSTVAPGQPVLTLYDPTNVWVTANIKETKVERVRPGQKVEISVDSLGGRTFDGTVLGVASATAATFSLLPQQNTTGNFTKVVQVVPVKIAIELSEKDMLIPGSSVDVRISIK